MISKATRITLQYTATNHTGGQAVDGVVFHIYKRITIVKY
jgi:hypothetical protein